MFVLSYWLSEFLLSAFANHFELRCEPKQLMLCYYEICPSLSREVSDDSNKFSPCSKNYSSKSSFPEIKEADLSNG